MCVCTLYVHCMYIVCTLYVHCMCVLLSGISYLRLFAKLFLNSANVEYMANQCMNVETASSVAVPILHYSEQGHKWLQFALSLLTSQSTSVASELSSPSATAG